MVFWVSRVHIQYVLCNIYLTFWSFNVQFSFCLLDTLPHSFGLLNSSLFRWHLICALFIHALVSCLLFFLKIILCIRVFGLPCVFVHHICAWYLWRPKLVLNSPELELQMWVTGTVGPGNWSGSLQEQPLLLSTELSLALLLFCICAIFFLTGEHCVL